MRIAQERIMKMYLNANEQNEIITRISYKDKKNFVIKALWFLIGKCALNDSMQLSEYLHCFNLISKTMMLIL